MKTSIVKIYKEDSQFQYIETLQRNRTKRYQEKTFFVEGVRAVTQALENRWKIRALVYSREKRLSDWAEGVIERAGASTLFELSQHLMEKISQKEETSELVALVSMAQDDLQRIPVGKDFLAVVLDRPSSPGNLGTIIRSCDALGVAGLVITGHAVDLYDPEVIRATAGSFFSVPVVRLFANQELVTWLAGLKKRLPGLQVVGTSANATDPVQAHDLRGPVVLLVGSESRGLSESHRELCDVMLTIPMGGSASSLNVACATSILLYEVNRQRIK